MSGFVISFSTLPNLRVRQESFPMSRGGIKHFLLFRISGVKVFAHFDSSVQGSITYQEIADHVTWCFLD